VRFSKRLGEFQQISMACWSAAELGSEPLGDEVTQ